MSSHYNIHIPVKPHIKKFIAIKEGDPVMPIKRSWLWMVIRPHLQYKVSDNLAHSVRKRILAGFSGNITLRVSISKVKSYGLHPRTASIVLINQFLDQYFAKELCWFVEGSKKNTGRYKGYKKAITQFCKKYNIELEEDISMNALEKLYGRHRDR